MKKLLFLSICLWLGLMYGEYCYIYVIEKDVNWFDLYGSVYLLIDYSKGLVPRGLLGEIFKHFMFSPGFHFVSSLMLMKTIFVGFMLCVFLVIFYKIVSKRNIKDCFLLCMLFVHPFYLLSRMYEIRNDAVWYLFLPLMLLVVWKMQNKYLQFAILILCSTICMLSHQAFIFTFAPLICVLLLLQESYVEFFAYGIILVSEFLIINFGFRNYDYNDMVNLVYTKLANTDAGRFFTQQYIDGAVEADLRGEYGTSHVTQIYTEEMYQILYRDINFPRLRFFVIMSVASLIVTIKSLYVWIRQNKKHLLLLGIILLPFVFLLCFTIDCERWFLMILLELNIIIGYLIYTKKIDVVVKSYMYVIYGIWLLANCCIYCVHSF